MESPYSAVRVLKEWIRFTCVMYQSRAMPNSETVTEPSAGASHFKLALIDLLVEYWVISLNRLTDLVSALLIWYRSNPNHLPSWLCGRNPSDARLDPTAIEPEWLSLIMAPKWTNAWKKRFSLQWLSLTKTRIPYFHCKVTDRPVSTYEGVKQRPLSVPHTTLFDAAPRSEAELLRCEGDFPPIDT
jgi:hypothetical protein